MHWYTLFFYLFALLACAFAVAVVVTSNVVRMAFYLVLSLGATAGLFFLAGADFVGAMQLMMYVGGTLVLLVFGVMLTAQAPWISIRTTGGEWVLAALVGGSLLAVLVPAALKFDALAESPAHAAAGSKSATHGAPGHNAASADGTAAAATFETRQPTATRIGVALVSGYLLPFEAISIHLLVVLIGAAYLARSKRRAKPKFADLDES